MWVVLLAVAGGCLTLSSVRAWADTTGPAELLYREGRQLMADGQVASACAKFAESQHLDPATGTLLNLATCHETQGKPASAWKEFRAAATAALRDGRADRVTFATEHLARLEPRLSYLTIAVPTLPGARVEGAEQPSVTLDDRVIGPAEWNVAAPIDPGIHVIGARANGYVPFQQRVTVGDAPPANGPSSRSEAGSAVPGPSKLEVVVQLALVRPSAEGAPLPVDRSPEGSAEGARTSGLKLAAYWTGGIAGAAVLAGGIFGVRAFSEWSARNDRCASGVCTPEGAGHAAAARDAATRSDICFGIGLVGMATSAYLFYRERAETRQESRPPTSSWRPSPMVSSSVAQGISVVGEW